MKTKRKLKLRNDKSRIMKRKLHNSANGYNFRKERLYLKVACIPCESYSCDKGNSALR